MLIDFEVYFGPEHGSHEKNSQCESYQMDLGAHRGTKPKIEIEATQIQVHICSGSKVTCIRFSQWHCH